MLCKALLKLFGWKVSVTTPDFPQSVICVAPHTSNWDFVLCELAIRSVNRHSGFMMKASWFRWPLGPIFRAMGGIPVKRDKHSGVVDSVVEGFRNGTIRDLAITPEGTRKAVVEWHTGFLRIAYKAQVPLQLACLDYAGKTITLDYVFEPTGDIDADMNAVKKFYSDRNLAGKHREYYTVNPSQSTGNES